MFSTNTYAVRTSTAKIMFIDLSGLFLNTATAAAAAIVVLCYNVIILPRDLSYFLKNAQYFTQNITRIHTILAIARLFRQSEYVVRVQHNAVQQTTRSLTGSEH